MLPSSPLRCFCPGTLLSVLLAVAPHVASSQASDVRRPNIVLILADDLGWCDTSFTGSRFYWTPNIERLARRGVYFPNAYAASPLCSPTRASIMTGQSPARCGITSPGCHTGREILKAGVHARANPLERQVVCVSATRLDTEHTTLAEALREGGYATGHFGKWHLGREPYSPLEHGFDVDIPHWPGPGPAGSFVAPWRFPNFRERVPKEHIEDRMGDEAVAFMEARKGRPFFLNYWQFSVHAPFNAKEELIEEYKKTVDPENPQQSPTYAAMIHSLDDNVGKILDALDRLGIAQDTVVIFYSDNGGNMYNAVDGDRTATSNAPLRGGKASMYEGGIRIPAIVSWPGVTKGGTTNEALIQSEDLYPTILEMAGLPTRPKQAKDGLSMVPILNGKEPLRDAVYCFFPHGPHVPDWLPPSVCVRQGDWKLIRIFHGAPDQQHRYELYDVVSDIGERRNLASVQPERVTALDALIERFLADTEAVIPTANPAYERARRESVAGWQVSSEARIGQRWDTLQVRSFGPDTALTTAVPMAAGPGRYVLDFRMRAWADGPGQVSWTSGGASHTAEASTPFALHTHGLWHDYRVALSFSTPVDALRFSPCSGQGTVQMAWMRLRDGAGGVVHEWDLKTKPKPKKPQPPVGGWQAGANAHASARLRDEAMVITCTSGDPMLMTRKPLGLPAGRYVFTMRMKAKASGNGQLFSRPENRGYQPGTGTGFAVHHDDQWHEYTITFECDYTVHEIRLDPCSGKGKMNIDWVRLRAVGGELVREWLFEK